MKDYYFTLAGLRTVLCVPFEISISESMQPFLCASHQETDCTITLRPCAQLPSLSNNGVWRGLEYYDCHQGNLRTFHCNAPRAAAFAVTEHFENGNIEMRVSPDYLSYFTGTAGIFNRIGMETLLLQHQGLLLHASLINYKGKAIAFAGPSGIGKSTQADIWHTFLGADIINGDRAALRKERDHWYAYGCPYAGTSGIYKNDRPDPARRVGGHSFERRRQLPLRSARFPGSRARQDHAAHLRPRMGRDRRSALRVLLLFCDRRRMSLVRRHQRDSARPYDVQSFDLCAAEPFGGARKRDGQSFVAADVQG